MCVLEKRRILNESSEERGRLNEKRQPKEICE
jgi:hypothetical protein